MNFGTTFAVCFCAVFITGTVAYCVDRICAMIQYLDYTEREAGCSSKKDSN
jgi:hypothetical protein